jgi:hypothetical protein
MTSASLCHQTADELSRLSSKLKIYHVGGDKRLANNRYSVVDDFPDENDPVWDPENASSIRKVYVMSYSLAAMHYGPQALWAAIRKDPERFCRERGINFATFDFHAYSSNAENLPDHVWKGWIRSLSGKIAYLFADECQDGCRNASSYWRTLRWMHAKSIILMSGYPAPRGMEDFGSYIRLLERPELTDEEDDLKEANAKLLAAGGTPTFVPGVDNPYLLPDTDPK